MQATDRLKPGHRQAEHPENEAFFNFPGKFRGYICNYNIKKTFMTLQEGFAARNNTDEDIEKIRKGDIEAFHGMVDDNAQYLYGMARSLADNTVDAEDILQETFAGALKSCSSFRGDSSAKTWLAGILYRQAAAYYRRKKRHKQMISTDYELAVDEHHTPSLDKKMDVAEAIDRLSSDHRQVVLMREMESMTYDEIAKTLDIPRGTVESRLFRARQELKNLLREYL